MRAIISSTYDSTYSFFIPITTWLWNKLGVDVICFSPSRVSGIDLQRLDLCATAIDGINGSIYHFDAPEHKEATYAQCLRNYAACIGFPKNELLVTSDVDMAVFKIPEYIDSGWFSIFGSDLVPEGQYPQCYITAPADAWIDAFNLYDKTYQQAIDELLGEDECQDYRGCRWSVDQEQSFLHINKSTHFLIPRARQGTQFASHRIDRDDSFFMDRLTPDIVDYHMHRPGYTEENIEKIISVISYFYPTDDLNWIREYAAEYRKLL